MKILMFLNFVLLQSNYGIRGEQLRGISKLSSEYVLLSILFPVLFVLVAVIVTVLSYYQINIFKLFKYFTPLKHHQLAVINEFYYYNSLDAIRKKDFERRVRKFLINKELRGVGIEITDEIKTKIACSVIQVTLGFSPRFLSWFKTIHVYPDKNKTVVSKNKNTITLYWHDFEFGYSINDDGHNQGLEILALALSLNARLKKEISNVFGVAPYVIWRKTSAVQKAKLIRSALGKEVEDRFNEDRIFSIAVVYFFEKPLDFKNKFPAIYHCFCRMMGQDPAILLDSDDRLLVRSN